MSHAALVGLAQLLQDRGVALYQDDGPSSIFLEYLPERTEHALSLTIYGAEADAPFRSVSWPRVQVRARGDRRSPRWSRTILEQVYRVLHGFRGELPNQVLLLNCHGLQTEAVSLGPDPAGRYEHVLNFQLWVCVPELHAMSTVPMEASHASS